MAAVSNSVVHLTMRFERTVLAIGTGVIYERNDKFYIVTAWHNLTGRHPDTLNFQSKSNAVPDNVVVNIAVSYPFGVNRISVNIPLVDEDKSLFLIHPTRWPRVDVAAIPFDPDGVFKFDHWQPDGTVKEALISLVSDTVPTELCPIQRYLVPNTGVMDQWLDNVEVTEELFIPGYPHNIQDDYSQPVWKRATIASSVQNGWNGQPKFLVDSASKSGMSGSPVVYYSPQGKVTSGGRTNYFSQDVAILAGIYMGRTGVTDEADPQVGIVWHRSVIDEIIDGAHYECLPFDIEAKSSEIDAAIKEELKTCSRKGLDNVRNLDMPSRYYVRRRVLERLSGRAKPDDVVEAILRVAETYDGPLVPDDEE